MKTRDLPAKRGYETSDANVRWIVGGGLMLAGGIFLCLGVAAICDHGHVRGAARPGSPRSFHAGPFERSGMAEDWQKQDAAVRAHLGEYGWIDRQHGIVHIPIRRAMELMAGEAAAAPKETP